jgi:hypothetical protein
MILALPIPLAEKALRLLESGEKLLNFEGLLSPYIWYLGKGILTCIGLLT